MAITLDGTTGITLPSGAVSNTTSTVVGINDTQTLINKTILASQLTGTQTIPKATLPTGSVLQVVQAYVNSGYTTTTSSTYVATALSGSITPTSSTSKILVTFSGGVYQATNGNGYYGIFRNGTNPANNQVHNAVINQWSTQGGSFLDTPATTSAITYAVYMRSATGSTTYFGGDSPLVNSITMMEIAA
jgi:hypothetical protein